MKDSRSQNTSLVWRRFLPPLPVLVCLGVTALILSLFFRIVDLKPQVDETFFFSKEDPQLKADKEIHEMFPGSSQLILVVTGEIRSPAYAQQIRTLSDELGRLPDITGLQSLSRGPKDIEDALKSALWRRLLISSDEKSSYIFVTWEKPPDQESIRKAEMIQHRFDRPGFRVVMSGMPYITELIARNLAHDLRVFSLAAACIFGVVLLVIFRSPWILLGTFVACADSGASMLIVTQSAHIPVGPLTANLSTMVFVMTLSPMVFLTFNWKHIRWDKEAAGRAAVWSAVRRTVVPSFWSAVCMLLGFISLLLVSSTPMKHLGIGGAIGASMAFGSAYAIYPWFLERASVSPLALRWMKRFAPPLRSFFSERHGWIVAGLVVFTVIGAIGLRRLNTDPQLPSYFKPGGNIRSGLELVDKTGGSSPLKLVIEDQQQAPLNTEEAYKRLWGLQQSLEKDPAVGNVLSLPLLLSEARRPWYSFLFSNEKKLEKMEEAKHGRVASHFVTSDRARTLLLLRMRETGQTTSRGEVIARLKRTVVQQGFRTVLIGGTYSLLQQMAQLVTSSIISGVLLLIGIFVVMGLVFSRSFQVAFAMLVSLAIIPVVVRGYIAYMGMPLDFITASAANLDLGMGVDAMIYLTMFARRAHGSGDPWAPWAKANSHLWQPIGTSLLIVCCGFWVFLLSNFPPTRRFGLFVMFGSATAATAALFMFPWLAAPSWRKRTAAPSSGLKAA